MRPPVAVRLLSGLFLFLAALDLVQLVQAVRGDHPDPPGLLLTHALTAGLGAFAGIGIWRRRRWAPLAVLSWGVVMGGMLWILGPVLDEPRDQWRALRIAGSAVVGFAGGVAWYLRWRVRALR